MPTLVYAEIRVVRLIAGSVANLTAVPGASSPLHCLAETQGIRVAADGQTVTTVAVPSPPFVEA